MHMEPMVFAYVLERAPSAQHPRSLLLALVGVLLLTKMQYACCLHHLVLVLLCMAAVDEQAREPIEAFIRSYGVPIKLAKAQCMEDVSKSLSGRDCKVLAERAGEIFPELLEFVLAPGEAIQAAAHQTAQQVRTSSKASAATACDAGESVFTMRRGVIDDDDDDDDDGDDDDNDGDEDWWSKRLRYAKYFDDFFSCVHAVRKFERDDAAYREERALELFNSGQKWQ
eukprot:6212466-Pleurochrysis_carterae.AAC.2